MTNLPQEQFHPRWYIPEKKSSVSVDGHDNIKKKNKKQNSFFGKFLTGNFVTNSSKQKLLLRRRLGGIWLLPGVVSQFD